ncbi:MAG: 2Fe-2S iron-sulfur cluster-binding protein [Kofleriaceae bacterium]|nr:2Fe-2S iron-sulfur cluster-binding protein [Kofleriaceae bacterium]
MSTSESADHAPTSSAPELPIVDSKLLKWTVIVGCTVPGLLLLWDAARDQLGVNDINFAIRSTGMLGLVFMTLSLVITPIRRLTGWNAIVGARRNLGVFGFLYIAAHFSIFFLFDRDGSASSTLDEIIERVYLWFGTASLVIMIPLAITSFDLMVTKLGPRRWKLLHRLAYVAVLCGMIHYYLLLKADKFNAYVYIGAFGGLMLFRLVRHYLDLHVEIKQAKEKLSAAKRMVKGANKKKFWTGELKIARIFVETHNVKTFRMVPIDGGPLPFEAIAGQYINLMLTIDGTRVNRSYTISSSPTRNAYVEITVKRDGLASTYLHSRIKEGDQIKVGAAAGRFYFAGDESQRVIMVAGGVGITPMMAVVRSLTDRCWPGDMYLIFAVRKRADVVFERELEDLMARNPNLHVRITLSDDAEARAGGIWDGTTGRITKEMVQQFVPGPLKDRVMLCGPKPMMEAVRKLFVEGLGVDNALVHEEAFVSPPAPKDEAAAESAMMAPATEAADAAGELVIHFKRSNKKVETTGLTVLEAAEDNGIAIPFECRSGICGQCKCKLTAGRVLMDSQDALTARDRAMGVILACQARPTQNCEIDA